MAAAAIAACGLCVVSYYFKEESVYLGAAVIATLFICIAVRVKPQMIVVLIVLVIVSINIQVTYSRIDTAEGLSGKTVKGEFKVVEEPVRKENYSRVVIKAVNSDALSENIKCLLFYNSTELECGDIIEAKIKLEAIEEEYKLYDYSNGIYLTANAKSIEPTVKEDSLLKTVDKVQKYITSTLFIMYDSDISSTLCALTYGNREYMSDRFYSDVKAAGVSHVMVVSGMHLAIIMSFITTTSEKLFYKRWVRALISVTVVLFMSAVCGFTVSIIRAGITYVLSAAAPLFGRDNCPANTLGTAVCIMLAVSPMAVFNLVFQLSVLSTFGVLVVAPEFYSLIKTENKFLNKLVQSVTVTISAMIMTLPVTVYCFGYISTVSILTNLLISYAVTVALVCAVSGLTVNLFVPALSEPFFFAAGILTKYINSVITYFASFENSTVDIDARFTVLFVILILVVLKIMSACKLRKGMVKLETVRKKVIKEGGGKVKWL